MKNVILIPVYNESTHLPGLFRALSALKGEAGFVFVDNGSTDDSLELIEHFVSETNNAHVFEETKRGFAAPMNTALREALKIAPEAENLFFLDADAVPDKNWLKAHESSLLEADVSVGETISKTPTKASAMSKLLDKVFHDHSYRTAHAHGHALPWGPTCNLAVRRSAILTTGDFSEEAHSAFDVDWCWRAVLNGAKIRYEKKARVQHYRRADRLSALSQFERYGAGEAWLHRTYAFLLDPEDRNENPVLASVGAFTRLRHHSPAAKMKSLHAELEELAVSFAGGVRLGYAAEYKQDKIFRKVPARTISWASGKNESTLFVPGKGVAQLSGKQNQLWLCWERERSREKLGLLMRKILKITPSEADEHVDEFISGVSP